MKTIGLLGGMSWESSLLYYQIVNQATRDRLGELHSAPCILYSVDFAPIAAWQQQGDWAAAARVLCAAAQTLERAGADVVVLCTNTMHKLAAEIQASIEIPLLHIADAIAARIQAAGLQTVALLGTRFTMEQDFYTGRLADRHNIIAAVPEPAARETVHRIIYDELCQGKILPASRSQCREILMNLVAAGAEGLVLACTELELLLTVEDVPMPLFPTARLHALAAVDWALRSERD
ncbi:MAG: aspartate/glutamate racemase family protein [Spirulinaceae cyanobacterium SM2_1_0]|nr:aspartate/glutamate racemase family protein [Spirulinaceae cyanobacterium SM2_1_0]